ncbi:MAG: TIGR00730 family Rossman fold protein [Bacteroidales bacterium]|nr:TIGR00730 family Rossman fold protein [Bacteroidales bacterium]
MSHIAVFCGSRLGLNPHFEEATRTMGNLLAIQGHTLVYGGSNKGYMGVVATAAMSHGGRVVAVIPTIFPPQVIHSLEVNELIVVNTLAERKQRMADMSEAFIALPGGIGTLDEITEMLANNQLNLSHKPIAFLNVDGFFDPTLQQLEMMHHEGFLSTENYHTVLSADTPETLLERIAAFR